MPENRIIPPDERVAAIRAAWRARYPDQDLPSTVYHGAQTMMRDSGCTPEHAIDFIMAGGTVVQRGNR